MICEEKLQEKRRYDGVVEAIHGTHIPIVSPLFMPNKYLNRKQYHSIVLQAVCDASYIFTDCFAGYYLNMEIYDVQEVSMMLVSIGYPQCIDK
ncbi:hypothetical protein JTB14_025892 [Gonioctena quinquepunctata]|nr:hypothetical protein JTB14_025892 [Gonioctena quinquepunctata]